MLIGVCTVIRSNTVLCVSRFIKADFNLDRRFVTADIYVSSFLSDFSTRLLTSASDIIIKSLL